MTIFTFHQGTTPILLSIPHNGTTIPDSIKQTMTDYGLQVKDTDWHLDQLYDFCLDMGISILCPNYSRYVIDLNRSTDGSNLYPGKNSTELCPLSTFEFEGIYQQGQEPDQQNIEDRINTYWQPYHNKITEELKNLKSKFGHAILFEGHSIRSEVARFFQGQLENLNIGTFDGKSCGTDLEQIIFNVLSQYKNYSVTLNKRFKGGYITRTYGQPDVNIHAVQLEITQCTYMNEKAPFNYQPQKARELKQLLKKLFTAIINWTGEN